MQRAGAAGRAFREFALGLNPLLAVPDRSPWIPYYGYGARTSCLSLGDNADWAARCPVGVRWNFFTDLTVTVGTAVWVRNGSSRFRSRAMDVPERFEQLIAYLESQLPRLSTSRLADNSIQFTGGDPPVVVAAHAHERGRVGSGVWERRSVSWRNRGGSGS
jgi:hypothetical protein